MRQVPATGDEQGAGRLPEQSGHIMIRDTVFEDAEGDGDQDVYDDRHAWYESKRFDAEVDRIREEQHFGN